MTIAYTDSAGAVSPTQLTGFCVGWPNPPSPETHLRLLRESDQVVLAWDEEKERVVGFITAITERTPVGVITPAPARPAAPSPPVRDGAPGR